MKKIIVSTEHQLTVENKNMEMENAPASIVHAVTSSVLSLERSLREHSSSTDQNGNEEPLTKKPRYVDTVPSSLTLEPNAQQMASFNDLPPEMHEKILNNVLILTLLKCRQVNRQWNEIACRIIRDRDIKIHFGLSNGKYAQRAIHRRCIQCSTNLCKPIPMSTAKSLTDLVAYLKDVPQFPFTSFRFDSMSLTLLKGLSDFLDIWGGNIRFLKITVLDSCEGVATLLKLLFEKVPNLKGFSLHHDLMLFPVIIQSSVSSSAPHLANMNQFQLAKLESLHVYDPYEAYGNIVEELLTSSLNLKTFSIIERPLLPVHLEMMYKSKKLHCLKDIKISITEDLITYWKKSRDRFQLPLRSLILSVDSIVYLDHQLNSSACEIINQLLHSSRNTMKRLVIRPLGQLNGLVFPRLEALRQLRLHQDLSQKDHKMLPALFDWAGKFPNLRELDVEHLLGAYDMVFDHSLKVVPSIRELRVSWMRNRHSFGELIKRTPNVTTLSIRDDKSIQLNQTPLNFGDISMYLPKLQNFSWHISMSRSLRYKLDALITGLPEDFCRQLAKKFRYNDNMSMETISRYWKPCNSSILDLSELQNLHLRFHRRTHFLHSWYEEEDNDEDDAGFDPNSIYYGSGVTKVSAFLGFSQIPNLKVTVHKTDKTDRRDRSYI